MAYRTDPDLEILAHASNDDLLMLADALVYKDYENKKKNNPRMAATLYLSDSYKKNYPQHLSFFWKEIAEELQKFGGHSGVNWIFRGNKGILYREILIDVCKSQKIKGINFKVLSTEDIENLFLEKFVVIAIEKMSDSDRKKLLDGLKNIKDIKDSIKDLVFSKEVLIEVVKMAFKRKGLSCYILTLQVVNGISRTILGRGLTFGANAALMKFLGHFISGPFSLAFSLMCTFWSFMGPNKDAILKGVVLVAYIRKKRNLNL